MKNKINLAVKFEQDVQKINDRITKELVKFTKKYSYRELSEAIDLNHAYIHRTISSGKFDAKLNLLKLLCLKLEL